MVGLLEVIEYVPFDAIKPAVDHHIYSDLELFEWGVAPSHYNCLHHSDWKEE